VLLKPFAQTPGGPARTNLNDIGYNGFVDNGAHDQSGNLINGTGQFTITIQVGPGVLGGIPAVDVHRIDVTVQHTSGVTVLLSG